MDFFRVRTILFFFLVPHLNRGIARGGDSIPECGVDGPANSRILPWDRWPRDLSFKIVTVAVSRASGAACYTFALGKFGPLSGRLGRTRFRNVGCGASASWRPHRSLGQITDGKLMSRSDSHTPALAIGLTVLPSFRLF
jgi:hypothetical protein